MEIGVGGDGTQVIHTVSQLNDKIKVIIEEKFPFVWITGEISNFSSPMSGHFYFSIKDEASQISGVMFRGQNRNLKFSLEDGMAVTGLGRVSLYKPRGTYQIIFEYLEPKGAGALQVAFEQLKKRLSDEGLFDDQRKTPLPFLPEKIAFITSPTGAVIQDMAKVTRRRFSNMRILLVPVRVQGAGSSEEIVDAIERLNQCRDIDVAILARGGGSMEDLQAFNSEPVARAIAASSIPIVSAIGHETDYTISDFVSDLRAPTPSAAAELVVPQKNELTRHLTGLADKMRRIFDSNFRFASSDLNNLRVRLVDPVKKIQELGMRCDDLTEKLFLIMENDLTSRRDQLNLQFEKLNRSQLTNRIKQNSKTIEHLKKAFISSFRYRIQSAASRHNTLHEKLYSLSPLSVLDRGYCIARTLVGKRIVRRETDVMDEEMLELILSRGALEVHVNRRMDANAISMNNKKGESKPDGDTNI